MHYCCMLSSYTLSSPNAAWQCFWSHKSMRLWCSNFWKPWNTKFISGTQILLQAKFIYQWHWIKVKVTGKERSSVYPGRGDLPSTERQSCCLITLCDESMRQMRIRRQLILWIRILWLRISGGSVTSLFHASDNTASDFPNSKCKL